MSSTGQIVSPCISVCTFDEVLGRCRGCYRTPREVGGWRFHDGAGRRAMLVAIRDRWRDDADDAEADDARLQRWQALGERLQSAGLVDP